MADKNLQDLLDQVRDGKISTLELEIGKAGKIKKVVIRSQHKPGPADPVKEIADSIRKVQLSEDKMSGADLSNTLVQDSDLSGLDLSGSDFSYTKIERTDMSNSNFSGASFKQSRVIQTDLSYSQDVDMRNAYLTGSVNLHMTNEPMPAHYKIKHGHQRKGDYDMSIKQGPASWWVKEDENKQKAYEVLRF